MKRKTIVESAVIFNDPQLTHGNKPGLWIGDGFGHAGCKDTPQTTVCSLPEVCLSVLLLKVTDADRRPCLSWHISSLFSVLALPDTASPSVAVASDDRGLRSKNNKQHSPRLCAAALTRRALVIGDDWRLVALHTPADLLWALHAIRRTASHQGLSCKGWSKIR